MIVINRAVDEIKVALEGGFNILNAPPHAIERIVNDGMGLRNK